MNLKGIILSIIQIVILFTFPRIWKWIIGLLPWWFLDPQTTLGIVIWIAVTIASWLLGLIGIRIFIRKMNKYGYLK